MTLRKFLEDPNTPWFSEATVKGRLLNIVFYPIQTLAIMLVLVVMLILYVPLKLWLYIQYGDKDL